MARMERQHVQVAVTLAVVLRALPAWQMSADTDSRDHLVSALSSHRRVLIDHFDDEESHLLPLAAHYLTKSEWAALGEHFVASTPKAQLLIFLGAVLEEATPDERRRFARRDASGGASGLVECGTTPLRLTHTTSSCFRHRSSPPAFSRHSQGGLTMLFSEPELAFLSSQSVGRLATVQPDGTLQVNPVGFTYNAELDTFDIHGFRISTSRKFRNVAANGRAAFVVDDVPSIDPWRVRCLEIRGFAEAITEVGQTQEELDNAVIRIHPERIISFGIVIPDQDPQEMTADNRDVARR